MRITRHLFVDEVVGIRTAKYESGLILSSGIVLGSNRNYRNEPDELEIRKSMNEMLKRQVIPDNFDELMQKIIAEVNSYELACEIKELVDHVNDAHDNRFTIVDKD